MISKKVAIIILNWNGWRDTLECIQSVLCSSYENFHIIVCDAASEDESLERLKQWASGKENYDFLAHGLLHTSCPVDYPLKFSYIDSIPIPDETKLQPDSRITFIQIGKNLGYAGGNNVGLRFATQTGEFAYFWVLNNDTVVLPDTLSELVTRVEEDERIGMCGSTLFYYDNPNLVQTLGGSRYNRWLASSHYILPPSDTSNPDEFERDCVEKKMDMVHGAAIFVRNSLIESIGYLNEEYFLFAEEIDWAIRAGQEFRHGYAPLSVIYHKRGRSTGNTVVPKQRRIDTDYFSFRSRLIVTRNYFPWALPSVVLGMLASALIRLFRGQGDHAKIIIKVIVETFISFMN